MYKKSQILIFDFILSLVILVIFFGLIFSYYFDKTDNYDIYGENLNLLNGFTMTKINSLNDLEIRDLFIQGSIKNIENTIANQVAEFYYSGDYVLARNLTRIFASNYIGNNYNTQILLINQTGSEFLLYENIVFDVSFNDSEVSSSISRKIFGFINLNQAYGPYDFKIRSWR
jgi:hypothetical protein